MAQSVVYADLKFATAPPSSAPGCPADSDEADSPYENVPLEPVSVSPVPSPGCWSRHWRVPVGLLAAMLLLLLLLLVATVALGTCYWQVTRSLQDTSHEHAAEQGRLSQELSVQEQSLEQTRLELAWAREELQRAWREGNSSQLELRSRDAELGRARQELALLEKELRASESNVSSLRACVNTDCCPVGWVLYRSKCLFISVEKKNWWKSHDDCRERSAQLLVQGGWLSWTVPHFVQANGLMYWIEDRYQNMNDEAVGLTKKLLKESMWTFCAVTFYGTIRSHYCSSSLPWICEKPPDLGSPSETIFTLPAKV